MSLYYIQKFLFEINRSPELQAECLSDPKECLSAYELTEEEVAALSRPDIGMLYHLGVNGQILMHFAAFHKIEWSRYLELMREGLAKHGPIRAGVYATTGYEGVDSHAARLGQESKAVGGVGSTGGAR